MVLFSCAVEAPSGLESPTTTDPTTSTPPNFSVPSVEVCDGLDNDLDGQIDEGVTTTYYRDRDGDGHGDPDQTIEACEVPDGYAIFAGDCDDEDDRKWDDAPEGCDGIDNDCDGERDEDHRADWLLSTVHSDGFVREIDIATGVTSVRATVSGVPAASNVNSADSLDANVLMVHASGANELVVLDSCDGTGSSRGAHGHGNLPGIAFGPDGKLYAVDVSADAIVRIDPNDLTSDVMLNLGNNIINTGIAYDCTEERFWVADQAGGEIFWYDPATNAVGGHQPSNVPFDAVGLEFDNTTRTLLASTGYELWRIDPATGDGTWLADLDTPDKVNDLVLLAPCP